jgi:glycosyltransferase involved in cell wall biosynthesis
MQSVKPRLVRITTVPVSLRLLLKGQMKYMKEQGFEVIMISSPGPDAEMVEQQEDCEIITLPMERTVKPLSDLRSLVRLTRILKNLQPDIVHTHTPKAGLLGMMAAKIAGVPVRLHTIAGLPWMEATGMSRWVLKTMEKLTVALANRVYPNSKGLYSFLQQEKITKNTDRLKLLGNGSSNGIDCDYFSKLAVRQTDVDAIRNKSGITGEGWVWIFAGRLVNEKGIHELLSAFQTIYQQYPSDQLWLLGDEEPKRDPLSAEDIQLMEQHSSIIRWGFQKDVRPFFAAADVLVFPSYREGMPNVPLQAGAMGCALIVTDINGCNEIVTNNKSGFLVQPKNTEQLLCSMQTIRSQPTLKEQFAKAVRTHIRSHYNRNEVWSLILKEYQYWMTKLPKRGLGSQ